MININTTEILNKILENLSSNVDNVEFLLYFPNRKFSTPLREKYSATIGVKSELINSNSNYQTNVFCIELLSPIDKDGKSVFSKAVEISSSLLDMDILFVQSCTIGDIEYVTSQRVFKITIIFTIEKPFSDNVYIIIDNNEYKCIITNEKSLYTACNIKVYGQSKPIDTVLSAYEYLLTIKAGGLLELPQKGFEIKGRKYKYINCFIQKAEVGENYSEYEVISKERVAL